MNDFSFKGLTEKWLELKKLSVKHSTYLKYEDIICNQILPYFEDMNIDKINDHNIIYFFEEKRKNLSDGYLQVIKYVLGSIIKLGSEQYVFPSIHMEFIKFPKRNYNQKVLSKDQQNQLLNYCKDYHNQLSVSILLSLYGGLRIGEISALRWKNIDFQNHVIHVTGTAQRQKANNTVNKTTVVVTEPKTKTSLRYVPIPMFLIHYLQAYKSTQNNDDFVLSNSSLIYEPRCIQKRFKRLCQKNNFDVNFHVLRHSYATQCVQQKVDIKSLSEILGHSKVSTTLELYVHTNIEYKKKEIEKLPSPSWI